MMESVWWIRDIDWRLSSGVIFFIQLILWGERGRKSEWPVRLSLSAAILCGGSWSMRYVLETFVTGRMALCFGYSAYIILLSGLFLLCYCFCVSCDWGTSVYVGGVVLTVYRMCWDAVKLFSAIPVRADADWTYGSPFQSVMSYVLYILISLIAYRAYRYFVRRPVFMPARATTGLYLVILLSQVLLEFAYRFQETPGKNADAMFYLTALLYCTVIYILFLMLAYLSLLQQENLDMQSFIASKQKYYEISREGILSLQIKCHDLKHQIARIRSAEGKRQFDHYLDQLSESIEEYNTVIDSGNKALDVVLTEKNILCSVNGVRFTYIVDGHLFDPLTEQEIYALFGNVMDNALEAMASVEHQEKKFISLRAVRRDDMVVLVVENYVEHSLHFEDGLPVTTKEDREHHGLGLRSCRMIAAEHKGSVFAEAENGVFRLTVSMFLLPAS